MGRPLPHSTLGSKCASSMFADGHEAIEWTYSVKCSDGARKRWLIAVKARTMRNVSTFERPVVPNCRSIGMTTRSRRETVHFKHPFRIKGIDRLLPPGAYEVVTDDEMIEGLSFPSFRRVATLIMVPCAAPRQSSTEMVSIGSIDLSDAQRIDASTSHE
jgi:hypothetical protein